MLGEGEASGAGRQGGWEDLEPREEKQTKKLSIKLKIPTGHPMALLCSDMKGPGGFRKGPLGRA